MESLLKAEGDIDVLIAFYSAHLDDRGQQHLTIARVLDEAGRRDGALDWAERGVRAAARPDGRLIDYLVARYGAAGRQDDLLELRRSVFQAERSLAHYRALRQAATDSGTWQVERPKALAELGKDAKIRPGLSRISPVLIDALLDDGDLDAAWTATDGGTVQAIAPLTKMTGDDVYRQIARLLLSARACHEVLGTPGEFRQYLTTLRTSQKRKPNLMKILADNGL